MMNPRKNSHEIDEERVIQTHSNLGLVDARPGESTFPTGTKNHSRELDYTADEIPETVDEVALEDMDLADMELEKSDDEEEEYPYDQA
jgi:hypothetical protein